MSAKKRGKPARLMIGTPEWREAMQNPVYRKEFIQGIPLAIQQSLVENRELLRKSRERRRAASKADGADTPVDQ